MPLINIRYRIDAIPGETFAGLRENLPAVAADALSCEEGGSLAPEDIMIEFDRMAAEDVNCKDIHVRVWAHDYPARRGENLATIRRRIAEEVLEHLPKGVSWYVWVLLAPTSYGSDTEDM